MLISQKRFTPKFCSRFVVSSLQSDRLDQCDPLTFVSLLQVCKAFKVSPEVWNQKRLQHYTSIDRGKSYLKKGEPVPAHVKQPLTTHDNGGSPFDVFITPEKIQVLSNASDRFTKGDLVWECEDFIGIWWGEGLEDWDRGSSLLVETGYHQFTFIADAVTSFETKEVIVDHWSPVGNSDVPYPLCVGKKNLYFFLEWKGVCKENFGDEKIEKKNWGQLYDIMWTPTESKPFDITHKLIAQGSFR